MQPAGSSADTSSSLLSVTSTPSRRCNHLKQGSLVSQIHHFQRKWSLRRGTDSMAATQALQGSSARTESSRTARMVFRKLDCNHDGSLNKEEVVAGLENMGEANLGYQLFDVLDTNKDGKITSREFVEGFTLWQTGVLRGSAGAGKRARFSTMYKIEGGLGHGTTRTTNRVYKFDDQKDYACKSVVKSSLRDESTMEAFRQEIKVHRSLQHPNIVALHDTVENTDECHLVMELCQGGRVLDVLATAAYSEQEVARLMRMLLEAVSHCHEKGVVHGDLKPENLLLTDSELSQATLKVIDFGSAQYFRSHPLHSNIVPSPYSSPEVVLGSGYKPPADVWSCGAILYLMMAGFVPFDTTTPVDLYHQIIHEDVNYNQPPWHAASEAVKTLLANMLAKDPAARPTVKEVLAHPWIQQAETLSDTPLEDTVAQGIAKFASMNRLKKATFKICAEQLSTTQVQELENTFKSLDKNGNGTVSYFELRTALSGLEDAGSVEKEMEKLMKTLDVDGNGMIEYGEFLAATAKLNILICERNLEKAFRQFDADGSGCITLDELKSGLQKASGGKAVQEKELLKILMATDKNLDGKVDYEEFMDAMKGTNAKAIASIENVSKAIADRVKAVRS